MPIQMPVRTPPVVAASSSMDSFMNRPPSEPWVMELPSAISMKLTIHSSATWRADMVERDIDLTLGVWKGMSDEGRPRARILIFAFFPRVKYTF
jgi:hypothetical protein